MTTFVASIAIRSPNMSLANQLLRTLEKKHPTIDFFVMSNPDVSSSVFVIAELPLIHEETVQLLRAVEDFENEQRNQSDQ